MFYNNRVIHVIARYSRLSRAEVSKSNSENLVKKKKFQSANQNVENKNELCLTRGEQPFRKFQPVNGTSHRQVYLILSVEDVEVQEMYIVSGLKRIVIEEDLVQHGLIIYLRTNVNTAYMLNCQVHVTVSPINYIATHSKYNCASLASALSDLSPFASKR